MFRYYIIDLFYGKPFGTDSEEVANSYIPSADHFVLDAKDGVWMGEDEKLPIEEIK